MSRTSESKKARRRKRQAPRGAGRTQAADPVAEAVAGLDEWVTGRGWVLDAENSGDGLVSWIYPPSALDVGDDAREPVTRIWIAVEEEDDEVALVFGAVLVGAEAEGDDGLYPLDPEHLADDLDVLEAYRHGQPRPQAP